MCSVLHGITYNIYTYQFNIVSVFGETVIREPQRFVKVISFSYLPNITTKVQGDDLKKEVKAISYSVHA